MPKTTLHDGSTGGPEDPAPYVTETDDPATMRQMASDREAKLATENASLRTRISELEAERDRFAGERAEQADQREQEQADQRDTSGRARATSKAG
jgi:hypothetical protein